MRRCGEVLIALEVTEPVSDCQFRSSDLVELGEVVRNDGFPRAYDACLLPPGKGSAK